MTTTRRFACRLVALLLGVGAFAIPALAGLSRAPSSHTEPTADGRHILVFLAPLLPADDCYVLQEEHDQTERLNNMYPASGCYEVGSTTPLWTAPWGFGIEWFISEDCRYLVALNIFGDGQQRGGSGPDWGLKFYDSGKEIRTHHVSALVDFPALMPLESSDWHNRWFGDSEDSCTIESGQFIFETSTHEYYCFDLATGAIVHEWRMWRAAVKVSAALLTIAIFACVVLVTRERSGNASGLVQGISASQSTVEPPSRATNHRLRYRMRTLFVLTFIVAALCVATQRWPHVVVLLAFIVAAILLTRASLRLRRSQKFKSLIHRRLLIALSLSVAGLAWFGCYILSAGPVVQLINWLDVPDDVRMAIGLTFYRPLSWAPDDFWPLKWYFSAWHGR